MEDELILVIPNMEHKLQAINFIEEVEKYEKDINVRYSGFSGLEKYRNNYEGWLKKIETDKNKEAIPKGRVTADVFFSVRKSDKKVVGVINIRHELNDILYVHGGHIGYSILPSERRKGYAYNQLMLALKYCKTINIKRALITCLDYNIGSSKTIEKAGGVLENIVKDSQDGNVYKRYWISLKKKFASDVDLMPIVNKTERKIISINDNEFQGDVVLNTFKEMNDKYMVRDLELCIADNNYKWLEFYDYNSRIRLTALYDEKENIIEWYFDIARKIGKENNIPYEDDMYLDVVLTPKGKCILLDEDEFREAFERKEMTEEEYREAYQLANNLIKRIEGKQEEIKKFTDKYLKEIEN